jgi:hypothetical protein
MSDETVTSVETVTSTVKKSHFGGRDHRITQLKLLKSRANKLVAVFTGTAVGEMLAEAEAAVADAIDSVKDLADWKPVRSSAKKAKFVPTNGDAVKIRTKKLEVYSLSTEEAESLTVESVTGKMARCKTASGVLVVVRVSHLAPRK